MQNKIETFTEIIDSIHCVSNVDEAVSAVLQKLLFCPFCDEFFTASGELADHIRQEHPDRLISRKMNVETNEVDEDAETIYICPHCRFAVDNNHPSPTSGIVAHIENHTRSIDPAAKISFQVSSDKDLIHTYVENKVESKLFCCPVCADIFGSREMLLRHLSFKHSDADSRDVPYETIKLMVESARDFPSKKKVKAKYKLKYPF